MIERVENELVSLAKRLQIEEEEMSAKYAELAVSNNLDLEDERQQLMAMSLTRQYVRSRLASSRSNSQQSFGAMVTGFFVGIEPVRDIMEYKRKNVRSRYNADASQALTDGLVAEIILEDGERPKLRTVSGKQRLFLMFTTPLLKSMRKLGLSPLMQLRLGNRATPTKTTVCPCQRNNIKCERISLDRRKTGKLNFGPSN